MKNLLYIALFSLISLHITEYGYAMHQANMEELDEVSAPSQAEIDKVQAQKNALQAQKDRVNAYRLAKQAKASSIEQPKVAEQQVVQQESFTLQPTIDEEFNDNSVPSQAELDQAAQKNQTLKDKMSAYRLAKQSRLMSQSVQQVETPVIANNIDRQQNVFDFGQQIEQQAVPSIVVDQSLQKAQDDYAAAQYKLIERQDALRFDEKQAKKSMDISIAYNIKYGRENKNLAVQVDYDAKIAKYQNDSQLQALQNNVQALSLHLNSDDIARINLEQTNSYKANTKASNNDRLASYRAKTAAAQQR